ncbi:hypothetical protein BJ742DRAFT_373424 [Cladochytrium replicatum]|nr:hypothetical protein BJ742DRAFT_373424 [Cladochytrium replicatum]
MAATTKMDIDTPAPPFPENDTHAPPFPTRSDDDVPPPFPGRESEQKSGSSSKNSFEYVINNWTGLHPEQKNPHVFLYEPADYPNGVFVHAASTSRFLVSSTIVLKTAEKPSSHGRIEIQVHARGDLDVVPVIDTRHPGVFGILLDSELLKTETSADVRPGAFGKVKGGFLQFLSQAFGVGSAIAVKVTVTVTLPGLTAASSSGSKRQRFITLEGSNGSISVDDRGVSTGQLPDNVFLKTTNSSINFGGAHELEEIVLETSNANIYAFDLEGLRFGGDGPSIQTSATFKTSNAKITISDVNSFNNIKAKTSNAKIDVTNVSGSSVTLKTSNATMHLSQVNAFELKAETSNSKLRADRVKGRKISLESSNSPVHVSEVECAETLKVETSNGKITIEDAKASEFKVDTSNANVNLTRVQASKLIDVETSNSSINVGENGIPIVIAKTSTSEKGGRDPVKIVLRTSNSPAYLHITGYEGTFMCSTSFSKAEVKGEGVLFTSSENTHKVGRIGELTGSDIRVESSSSKCVISFE